MDESQKDVYFKEVVSYLLNTLLRLWAKVKFPYVMEWGERTKLVVVFNSICCRSLLVNCCEDCKDMLSCLGRSCKLWSFRKRQAWEGGILLNWWDLKWDILTTGRLNAYPSDIRGVSACPHVKIPKHYIPHWNHIEECHSEEEDWFDETFSSQFLDVWCRSLGAINPTGNFHFVRASAPQRLALPASNVAVGSVINLDSPILYVLYGNKELILIGQFFSRSSDQALSGVLCLWQQNTVLVYLQQKCSVPRGVRIVDWRLGTEDSLLPSK